MLFVVEDDRFLRIVQLVLDPNASRERYAAFTDFFAHDEPDFAGWCEKVRQQGEASFIPPRCDWWKRRKSCGRILPMPER